MQKTLEHLVTAAQTGDQVALEKLVQNVQDQIHHLAMRILVNPDDAQEATQEILILVITRLSTFEGKSTFRTWVYRVAANYLFTAKKVRDKDPGLNFDLFKQDLESGFDPNASPSVASSDTTASAENRVWLNELRISCTMAMLLCLDLKHRLAYVLGDILDLPHSEAAEVLDLSPANYRKRLSRARSEVVAFTSSNCGIANSKAKCSCPRRLPAARKIGRIPEKGSGISPAFALQSAPDYNTVIEDIQGLEKELQAIKLQRATPAFSSPQDFAKKLVSVLTPEKQSTSLPH
ncbi:RNA polymerase sigma factor [Kiloniella sp. EL199]|uniref:RNA polymerase sigma factor n=1 Tax=Kiloniella sp. EL199 TaxID=2107581 RepID=UPI000EA20051|nr:RNA polymerase sigma factor [Kiloniella sp. EL199]